MKQPKQVGRKVVSMHLLPIIQEGASCRDYPQEIFFPSDPITARSMVKQARRICRDCPVKDVCLEHALQHEYAGIWAGTSPEQRVQLRKERKR